MSDNEQYSTNTTPKTKYKLNNIAKPIEKIMQNYLKEKTHLNVSVLKNFA